MNKRDSYIVETFAVFQDVDASILKLNPTMEKYGYQFICISIKEFESDFSHLVGLKKGFESKEITHLSDVDIYVSSEFIHAIINFYGNKFFGKTLKKNEFILLKKLEDYEQIVMNGSVNTSGAIKCLASLRSFSSVLLTQLRLLSVGPIYLLGVFQIEKIERFVTSSMLGPTKHNTLMGDFDIQDEQADEFERTFNANFTPTPLTELAINNYNLAYDITDQKTRYVVLSICLESLFNVSKDQITHTISRHLSLVISIDEQEFQSNYKRIKKLYGIRSTIVHGNSKNDDIGNDLYELFNLVRRAIIYCQRTNLDQKQLFDKLNAKGF